MKTELLRMDNISKMFAGTVALRNVCINLFEGEVLGLVGENGAGKTTLMKILSGVFPQTSGGIYFMEEKVQISTPLDAQKMGISSIHQEFHLIPNISIAENLSIVNNRERGRFFYNKKKALKEAKSLLNMVGVFVGPDTIISKLSVIQKQMVQIALAISTHAHLIIMDETTSALMEKEVDILKIIMKKLVEKKVSIIFISNRLREVMEVSDRITVLKDGSVVKTFDKNEFDKEMLIKYMTGNQLVSSDTNTVSFSEKKVLELRGVCCGSKLKDISFSLKKGEILGITGLVGAGKSDLMDVIFGIRKKSCGTIYVDGKKTEINEPWDAIKSKIGYVPEDRMAQGLYMNLSVKDNIITLMLPKIGIGYFMNKKVERYAIDDFIKTFEIEQVNEEQKMIYVSSSVQQKMLISKWVWQKPKVLIVDEPTKGVSIETKAEIHKLIRKVAQSGAGVIVVSAEIREVLNLCDRVIVMQSGMIKGTTRKG